MTFQNKYLPSVVLAVLILFGIYLIVLIDHTANTAATTNTVTFSGQGKITATPDVAVVSASIVTSAATSKAAQDDNSKKSQAVVSALKKLGIDEKDIKTTGYNIYPQYSYPRPCPPGVGYPCVEEQQKISGYHVAESLEIKVRKLDLVSSVLDKLVAAGANQVNNLGLQIDDPEKLKSEARAKAIRDARDKAKELEKAVGIRLGKVVNFSEEGGPYPIPLYGLAKEGVGGGGPAPEIPTGQNEITVNVNITYQIK